MGALLFPIIFFLLSHPLYSISNLLEIRVLQCHYSVRISSSTHVAPLYRRLVEEGYEVQVSHPKKTRYIVEARIKTDRMDSRAIAELVRLDALPRS